MLQSKIFIQTQQRPDLAHEPERKAKHGCDQGTAQTRQHDCQTNRFPKRPGTKAPAAGKYINRYHRHKFSSTQTAFSTGIKPTGTSVSYCKIQPSPYRNKERTTRYRPRKPRQGGTSRENSSRGGNKPIYGRTSSSNSHP